MTRFDGTGPKGQDPMTRRGQGQAAELLLHIGQEARATTIYCINLSKPDFQLIEI